jgi:hypothetical protein
MHIGRPPCTYPSEIHRRDPTILHDWNAVIGLIASLVNTHCEGKELAYPVSFIDDPASHTMTVMDVYQEDFEAYFRSLRIGTGLYPYLPPYTLPSDANPIQR